MTKARLHITSRFWYRLVGQEALNKTAKPREKATTAVCASHCYYIPIWFKCRSQQHSVLFFSPEPQNFKIFTSLNSEDKNVTFTVSRAAGIESTRHFVWSISWRLFGDQTVILRVYCIWVVPQWMKATLPFREWLKETITQNTQWCFL